MLGFPLTMCVICCRHGSVASESSETSDELVAQEPKIIKKYTRSVLRYTDKIEHNSEHCICLSLPHIIVNAQNAK